MKGRELIRSQIARNLSIDDETVSEYWIMVPDEYSALYANPFFINIYSCICIV
jgi:hypothetical protein